MKKISLLIIVLTVAVLITGCWDMIEINQRLFPYSVGVDKDGDGARLKVTISYPNINAIGKNASQEDSIYIVSASADSVFEGARELSTRLPYPFYFKHLRVLVFGEELAGDGKLVKEILDGMARDFIINKKIRLVVAEGKAEDILMFKPNAKKQGVIEGALLSMLSKDKKIATYTPQTLTEFIQSTDLNNIALMPKAKTKEDEIKLFGGCIFKDYACIGDLDEKENRVVALVTGKENKALLMTEYEDIIISFMVSGAKIKKKLIWGEGNLKVNFNIEMEGKLQEYILEENTKKSDEDFIKGLEDAMSECFKNQVEETVEVLQKVYQADALQIGEYIQKFHPKVWKEIEEDWDEIFPTMDIECNVKVKLRRRGLLLTK